MIQLSSNKIIRKFKADVTESLLFNKKLHLKKLKIWLWTFNKHKQHIYIRPFWRYGDDMHIKIKRYKRKSFYYNIF